MARYCARCGRSLNDRADDPATGHSMLLLSPPAGFSRCDGTPELYYQWESGWGGRRLLSTETHALMLFNAGATMNDVAMTISALDWNGKAIATIRSTVAVLPRGETIRVEVPSYELPDGIETLTVAMDRNQPAAHGR